MKPVDDLYPRITSFSKLHAAAQRVLRRFARASRQHRWVLTADIRLYFPSTDHRFLLDQLRLVIGCPATLWLLERILAKGAESPMAIDAFPGDTLLTPLERPRGLPIGNLVGCRVCCLHPRSSPAEHMPSATELMPWRVTP